VGGEMLTICAKIANDGHSDEDANCLADEHAYNESTENVQDNYMLQKNDWNFCQLKMLGVHWNY
jgi:hypothetical protein